LTLGLWPDVVPFPLANGAASPVLEDLIGGPAAALTAVALVAGPAARASGWAGQAALALAARWRGPRRIVLADLDLDRPSLHEAVGIANEEGVVDLIDYGLSLARLVQPAGDQGFEVLPAGLFAPDPEHILRHDGWTRVLLEVAERRATLLIFVPADAAGVEAVIERAGAVLVLAEEDEAARTVENLAHPYAVLAILTPERQQEPEAEAELGAATAALQEDSAASIVEPPPDVAAAAAADEEQEETVVHAESASAIAETHETWSAGRSPFGRAEEPECEDVASETSLQEHEPPASEAALVEGDVVSATPSLEDELPAPEAAWLERDVASATSSPEHEPPASDAALVAGDVASETPSLEDELPAPEAASLERDIGTPETTALEREPDAAEPGLPARDGGVSGTPSQHRDDAASATLSEAASAATERSIGGDRLSDEEFDRIRLPTDRESRDALIAELRERQRSARLAGESGEGDAGGDNALAGLAAHAALTGIVAPRAESPPPRALVIPSSGSEIARELEVEPRADDVELEALTPPPRRPVTPAPGRYRRPLVWTLGVVLLTSILAGAWRYLSGLLPRDPAVITTPAPVPDPVTPPLADDALPYVVAIEAHRDLLTAAERVTDLREIEPELAFHIEPLERDGVVYYHVMAGPVPDSTLALALRDTLIARGHKTGRTPTDVRATPFAYLVGEYPTEDDAQEQIEVLRRLDVPGYVLRAAAADGEPVFRLYVGGFGGEAEAGAVGQMLRAAGIRDTLVTRTGAVSYGALLIAPGTTHRDSTARGSITP
jgi:hypothetical protein